jgi:DNA-binding response OmpR family regulator
MHSAAIHRFFAGKMPALPKKPHISHKPVNGYENTMKPQDKNYLKILLIDDDPSVHNLYKFAFENAGFSYLQALTSVHAMKILELESVSLIIIDGMLPDIPGASLCRMIRLLPNYESVPIIFFSAYFRDVSLLRNLFVETRINLVLPKPQPPEDLIRHVSRILKKSFAAIDQPLMTDEAFMRIRTLYIQSFFDQLREIENLLEKIAGDPSDVETLKSLRQSVHKIHGSAGSYGYTLVSHVAGLWERKIDGILNNPPAMNEGNLNTFRSAFEKIKMCFQLPDEIPERSAAVI